MDWFIVIAALGGASIASLIFPHTELTENDLSQGEELTVAHSKVQTTTQPDQTRERGTHE